MSKRETSILCWFRKSYFALRLRIRLGWLVGWLVGWGWFVVVCRQGSSFWPRLWKIQSGVSGGKRREEGRWSSCTQWSRSLLLSEWSTWEVETDFSLSANCFVFVWLYLFVCLFFNDFIGFRGSRSCAVGMRTRHTAHVEKVGSTYPFKWQFTNSLLILQTSTAGSPFNFTR